MSEKNRPSQNNQGIKNIEMVTTFSDEIKKLVERHNCKNRKRMNKKQVPKKLTYFILSTSAFRNHHFKVHTKTGKGRIRNQLHTQLANLNLLNSAASNLPLKDYTKTKTIESTEFKCQLLYHNVTSFL